MRRRSARIRPEPLLYGSLVGLAVGVLALALVDPAPVEKQAPVSVVCTVTVSDAGIASTCTRTRP